MEKNDALFIVFHCNDAKIDKLYIFNLTAFCLILQIDLDGNGTLSVQELGQALEVIGYKLPAYEIRDLIQQFSNDITNDQLSFDGFQKVGRIEIKLY